MFGRVGIYSPDPLLDFVTLSSLQITQLHDSKPPQPFAWMSREHLRKALIGKEVSIIVEYTIPNSGRGDYFLITY